MTVQILAYHYQPRRGELPPHDHQRHASRRLIGTGSEAEPWRPRRPPWPVGCVLRKLQAYLSNRKEDSDLEQLSQELGTIHAALLGGAAQAPPPPGQLHEEPARTWAGEARELAYAVEDAVDGLLINTSSPPPPPSSGDGDGGDPVRATQGSLSDTIRGFLQRAADLSSTRPQIPGARTGAGADNPRKQQRPADGEALVVGVDDARDGLIRRLRLRDEAGDDGMVKVVSVVGPTGQGKTTLAGAAYGVLRPRFDCAAFVSIGLDPDIPEVLEGALRQFGVTEDAEAGEQRRDERNLVNLLREFLQSKRYFIVLDDLWDKSSWEKIRTAFADNDLGSRIATATRNLDVADEIGATYELKPLSPENSKTLFFRTVFGCEDKCPYDEFTEVADKILEKCGGVPLAIVTLAKLLSGKPGDKGEWHRVCESIGSSLESTTDVKNMRLTVSTGYYNLPLHLRACLLYMSIFPENYEIRRDRLIWRWIAEGFVQTGNEQGESLFDLGLSYFDHLVNRGMIQFLDIDYSEDGCRDECCCSVSFPVMDFIRYLSSQESFVTVLDGEQWASPSDVPVRRVSIRGGSETEDSASMILPHLRSLTVFSPATPESIDLVKSEFLRVLDLEGCDLSESAIQKHLASLIHLRYLSLRETAIASVSDEIGNLKLLQILDLDRNIRMKELPASVSGLGELVCLRVPWQARLPSGIRNLTALEELSDATTRDSPDLVKELGSLTKLRVLRITLWKPAPSQEEALVASLHDLANLQTLDVYVAGGDGSEKLDVVRQAWAPPRCLREFRAGATYSSWTPLRLLPSWLISDGAAAVPLLAVLVVQVAELRQQDLEALGRLPSLRVLSLEPYATADPLHVAGGAFPRLTECRFRNADVAPVFRPGAMPRLRRLELCFRVRRTVDLGNAGFEFGLKNLACLEDATVYVACQESREPESEAAEKALQRAADGHPNRAAFDVITFGEELMCFDDDDQ